jgi:type I site-specific restriction-modification system R (restriction) subunit
VVNQLRVNTDNSHHRYDVILLINGVPVVQIELKTLGISPRRAMEQIVEYKNDPGNGYTKTIMCFLQLFIVSNRDRTFYFANNNARHFAFNAEERFLPAYEFDRADGGAWGWSANQPDRRIQAARRGLFLRRRLSRSVRTSGSPTPVRFSGRCASNQAASPLRRSH